MNNQVFIDTSAWIAYYLSDETNHIRVKSIIKRLLKERATIFTSNDVIDETVTRLVKTTNSKIVAQFIKVICENIIKNSLTQLWINEQIQAEAFKLVEKFAEHKLSLTDAATIALVRKYNIDFVVSLDSDFVKVGINTLP